MLANNSIYRKLFELLGFASLMVLLLSLLAAPDARELPGRRSADPVRAQDMLDPASLIVDEASLMDGASIVDEAEAPAQATPGDPPSIPTLPPERLWRLRLRAFPDTVGKGAYKCPGCDGVFGSGDQMGSAGRPLQPLVVAVHQPGNVENVYWMGKLKRQIPSQAEVYADLYLTMPPPYEVRLVTVDPLGYTLCPNSPAVFFVDQKDFDAIGGGAYGSGRSIAQDWFFWRCAAPR